MRRLFKGILLAAGLAVSGISPASAMLVSAGDPSFTVNWSCSAISCDSPPNTIPGAGITLQGTASLSNFAFSNNGTTFTYNVSVENDTPQGSLSTANWQSVRLTSFGYDTLPAPTGGSQTGAAVFTGVGLDTTLPGFMKVDVCSFAGNNCSGGSNNGLRPAGSGATPTDDAFVMTLTGLPTGTTSFDFGTSVAGGTEELDVKFQTGFGSFEFQNSPCTGNCGDQPPDVPEPASLALLGGALMLFGLFGWFSRRLGQQALLAV